LSLSSKHQVRAWGVSQRAALSSSYRSQASHAIAASLRDWLRLQPSPLQLLLYRGVRDEVDSASLFVLPAADVMFAPVVLGDAMAWFQVTGETVWCCGRFGVLEPQSDICWQPLASIPTIVVCPLTAFDRNGGRIGMGKGYFDRWLAEYRPHLIAVVGLAFACQEHASIPMDAHDQPLQWVITEKECIVCHSKF